MEFAAAFVVFFLVCYAILTYGLIFTAQQSVTLAAEEGARAALRWQGGGDAWQARAEQALAVAQTQSDWLRRVAGAAAVPITVCGKNAAGEVVQAGSGPCEPDTLRAGQMVVVVSYLYASAPLVPSLLGSLRVGTPERLVGRAGICLGVAVTLDQDCGSTGAAPT